MIPAATAAASTVVRAAQVSYEEQEVKHLLEVVQGMEILKHSKNCWEEAAKILNKKFHNDRKPNRLKGKFYLVTKDNCDSMKPCAEMVRK
jgi:hypothetical protein